MYALCPVDQPLYPKKTHLYYLKRIKWFLILPNTFHSLDRPTYLRPTFVTHRSYGPGPKSWLLVRPAWRPPPLVVRNNQERGDVRPG